MNDCVFIGLMIGGVIVMAICGFLNKTPKGQVRLLAEMIREYLW